MDSISAGRNVPSDGFLLDMEIFIAALVLVALCIIGLCFNIIFRKNGKFPETEIENNVEMRKRGIKCAKEEEPVQWLGREEVRAAPAAVGFPDLHALLNHGSG